MTGRLAERPAGSLGLLAGPAGHCKRVVTVEWGRRRSLCRPCLSGQALVRLEWLSLALSLCSAVVPRFESAPGRTRRARALWQVGVEAGPACAGSVRQDWTAMPRAGGSGVLGSV
jgi:hypothetical protein